MKRLLYILFFFWSNCYAQEQILEESDVNILASRKIAFNIPDGYNQYKSTECFDNYPFLNRLLRCLHPSIISADKESIIFVPIYGFFAGNIPDSIAGKDYFPNWPIVKNQLHIRQIKGYLVKANKDFDKNNWKDFVEYLPQDASRKIFNADTVINFTIKLDDKDLYQEKYKYVHFIFMRV